MQRGTAFAKISPSVTHVNRHKSAIPTARQARLIQVIEDTHIFADFEGQWISHALGMTADRGAMTKRMQDHLLGLISPASGQTLVNWTKFVDNPVRARLWDCV